MATRRRTFLPGALVPVLALLVLSAGCGAPAGSDESGDRLRVVTTVAPLTSIVANVAGAASEVTGTVPEGTDSHTFEPSPRVARALSRADVIFVNGLGLEEPTLAMAARHGRPGVVVVRLGDEVLAPSQRIFDSSFPESEGRPNPHLWTDPTWARRYARVVRDTLVAADPARAGDYRANFTAFAARIDALDRAIREATATLEPGRRKLLTYHDAFAYFARTYGWQVVGAIEVGSFSDPSPREVARLIGQVRAEGVPAIFGSEVFPSPTLEQIGREAGVTYVDVLRDDDLPGRPGQPGHSWLELVRFDVATMVRALGGDPGALEAVDTTGVVADSATYPQ